MSQSAPEDLTRRAIDMTHRIQENLYPNISTPLRGAAGKVPAQQAASILPRI